MPVQYIRMDGVLGFWGFGVLLNTSFNVNGKPILSRYTDALQVYDKTKMDGLVLSDYYFKK